MAVHAEEWGGSDIAGAVGLEHEEMAEVVAALVAEHAERSAREAEIVALRLGVGAAPPATLSRIAARQDISRDRARQLHTRAVGHILRRHPPGGSAFAVFTRSYPPGTPDQRLVRTLLAEIYATDADLAANELAYLRLRLAGHPPEDARRIAGFVMQRILGWRKKTRRLLAALHEPAPVHGSVLGGVEWADGGSPAPLPGRSARPDADDDGRGRFYLDSVGRDVAFDSGLRARLLRLLDADPAVETFQEDPVAVELEGVSLYPGVAVRGVDGRIALIDVQPLSRAALYPNRVRSRVLRAWAQRNGWGWMVWTGSEIGVAELAARAVTAPDALVERLRTGPVGWSGFAAVAGGLELLDLAALVVREGWRWERAPFRLGAEFDRLPGAG
ncbi:sigma factor-like helix-turn-helix DNA-binding protein [Nocardia harenae]|uniref:sigma factor-like helix-turn-helix DNA-binding protein n=1 Tax=Nocardia harenae TaxID=358707 RepID=UPI000834BD90|nr:sigma factor-like helix-turn-helix DNA-binding protein [Nocardia harenae]